MKKLLVLLCLSVVLLAGGCGGDDEEAGGGPQPSEQPEPAGGGGAGGGDAREAVEVSMKGIEFLPEDVTVKKGGTVTWTNDESVGHDVTKAGGPGPDFSSGEAGGLSQGDTFEQTFGVAGKVEYVCTVHSGMTGTVTVE